MWIGMFCLKASQILVQTSQRKTREQDIDNLYAMGVSLASAGAGNAVSSILGNSSFNGTIMDKTSSVIEIAENV